MTTTETEEIKPKLDCWGIVEIFGHTRIAGHLVEEERLGGVMLRVDVPDANGEILYTRWFGCAAIFSLSPTSRKIAIKMAQGSATAPPVKAYELPSSRPTVEAVYSGVPIYEGPDDDDGQDDEPL